MTVPSTPLMAGRSALLGRFLRVGLLAVFTALLIELSYRCYLFGWSGLSFIKVDTDVNIGESGLLKASAYPEVIWELIPNQDTWYKLARFRTNSDGLADREYARKKPKGTFRIVLLGSSFSMPTGVALEDSWQELLENQLNARAGGRRCEVINFSVAAYDPRQLLATLRHRAAAYDPDLILVDVTLDSPWILQPEDVYHWSYVQKARDHPALHSFALDRLFPGGSAGKKPSFPTPSEKLATFERVRVEFMNEARALRRPLCFVILQHDRGRADETRVLRDLIDRDGACVIDTSPAFRNEDYGNLTILKTDYHPNAKAQRIFAQAVYDFLVEHRLAGTPR